MEQIRKRAEQRVEDTWNLEAIYASSEDWKADAARLEGLLEDFKGYQGHVKDGADQLLEIMEAYCKMTELFEKIFVYAHMHFDEDMGNSFYQKLNGEARAMMPKYDSAVSWLQPELLELSEETLERYFRENEKLELYRIWLKDLLRKKAHTLTTDQERMLALAGEMGNAPYQIYSIFENADLTFGTVEGEKGERLPLTSETFVRLQENRNRRIRKEAFCQFYGVYQQFGNTIAALFDANVRQAMFFARERHYSSNRAFYLDDAQIPEQVYDNLIDTVHKNLPVMHRYAALRKKMLGVEELHMYDVYAPMVSDVDKKFTFEEAKAVVKEGLKPLGEDYLAILQEGFDNRWIDIYENTGKRGGAYSGGSYATNPYVLLNFQGNLSHVFTLAHEMGHSIHSYYTRKNQPFIYGDYKIFVAEVASTCNEALLIHSLLEKTTDKQERKYLINYFLEQFKSTLYRQTMFAEFEKITHGKVEAGESLNAETLCDIYLNLNKTYFGDAMVSDPEIAWEWARIPHFYTPFYVYQYATGFSAAIAIAEKIRNQEPGAVENYKKFLSGGSSMTPIELLKLCGVDMESPKPIQAALDVFAQYLGSMEEE